MEDYVAKLNEEEIQQICIQIGGKELKNYYRNHSNAFNKIRPGFRPQNLPDQEAVSIAYRNVSKSFIRKLINTKIDAWLTEIKHHHIEMIQMGHSEKEAQLVILSECVFHDNIAVLFKLCEATYSDEEISDLQASVNQQNQKTSSSQVMEDCVEGKEQNDTLDFALRRVEALENDKRNMLQQLEKISDELNKSKTQSVSLQEELDRLQLDFDMAQTELVAFKKNVVQSHHVTSVIKENSDYPYISVCKVYHDSEERVRLERLIDVDIESSLYKKNFLFPTYTYLFGKDGPIDDGFIGIWRWNVKPNFSDPTKDYISTHYESDCKVVEVVHLSECKSIEDILNSLHSGIEGFAFSEQVLFCYLDSQQYRGVLCERTELIERGEKSVLKDTVVQLPIFSIHSQLDTISFDRRIIANGLVLGYPEKMVNVKDSFEVLRSIVLTRASWPIMKQRGLQKNEYKNVKAFLESLPRDGLEEALIEQTNCSSSEASHLINQFVLRANDYIDGTSIENDILLQVVSHSQDLRDRCKALLTEQWEAETESQRTEVTNQLMMIRHEIEEAASVLRQMTYDIDTKSVKHEELLLEMDKQQKLAVDVEHCVQERIERARANVADFIAMQSFVTPTVQPLRITKKQVSSAVYHQGARIEDNHMEEYEDWNAVIDALSYAMEDAGVSQRNARAVGALLYAAYLNHRPVLLMGPNGRAIADAFSTTLFAQSCDVVSCAGEWDSEVTTTLAETKTTVVAIEQPFTPGWHQRIIGLTQNKDKFWIAMNPYAEDVRIESKGLLNYWLPVMTEMFVCKDPVSNFVPGKQSDHFKAFVRNDYAEKHFQYNQLLNNMHISMLAKNCLKDTIIDLHGLLSEGQVRSDILLLLFPCAFITDSVQALYDAFESNPDCVDVIAQLRQYTGDEA